MCRFRSVFLKNLSLITESFLLQTNICNIWFSLQKFNRTLMINIKRMCFLPTVALFFVIFHLLQLDVNDYLLSCTSTAPLFYNSQCISHHLELCILIFYVQLEYRFNKQYPLPTPSLSSYYNILMLFILLLIIN